MEKKFATCKSHSKTVEMNGPLYMELPFYFFPRKFCPDGILPP